MARLLLKSLADTSLLGKFLGQCANLRMPFLLHGPIGAGKTTLVRSIVSHLDNSNTCEVSSPSFSIYNIYPASVPILHADLYRCRENFPEEILELAETYLLVMEWAEYFRPTPVDYLDISLVMDKNTRLANLCGYGKGKQIEQLLPASPAFSLCLEDHC